MNDSPEKSDSFEKSDFSSRQIRKDNDRAFLGMVLFTLVVVGGGLIGLIYGWAAILTAVPILLVGAFLIFVPWGVLVLLQKWRDSLE